MRSSRWEGEPKVASGERAISADLESRLRAACADLDARLRRGEPATAELYFVADPALGSHADSAVELIYTEFVALQEIGRRPRTSDFLRRFPRWRTALEEQLQIHALMAGNEAENATLAGNSLATLADSGGGSQPFAAAAGPAEPGELWLDRYEIGAELGRGGMGVVYQARDVQTEEPVAVKILSVGPCANDDRERWRREAEAESQLGHRHIVQVLALGEHRGRLSLVLELVPGRSLAEYLGGRPQQPRPAAALVEKLARAIHFAHEKGVLHRDLKPSNVLLAPRPMDDLSAWDAGGAKGERFEPKIGDFGLAKRFVEDSSRTTTGAMIGTPSYMAPEQAGGGSYVGPASDVYSLGAVLYELLTGRPPFAGETALETLRQVVWEEPSPPRRVIGWAPRDLETICLKCLSKEPYCRYATAAALADDLSRFLAGRPIAARAKSWPRRLISWSRRRPTVAALGVVGLAVAILLGALSVRHAVELERSNQRLSAALLEAEIQRERAARERAVAERQTEGYRKQFELARRGAYAQLLVEVGNFWRRDPGRGLTLLDNQALCPPDLHDFTWQLLHRLCDRELGRLAAPNGEFEWARFAPDGRTAATFGPDGVVRWWHVAPDSPADTWRTIQT
ncbi:MAG TPA: serine/threonine-protein kinase, partial [Pirellulales bacterium]